MCVRAVAPNEPSSLATGNGECTDGNGVDHVTRLRPGTYNLFVFAMDGVHGDQWVGAQRGTGEQKKAADHHGRTGTDACPAPPSRWTNGASLTGVIRDKAHRGAAGRGRASFTTQNAGLGSSIGLATTDGAGRYTFTELGPYDWPIFYQAPATPPSGRATPATACRPIRYGSRPARPATTTNG